MVKVNFSTVYNTSWGQNLVVCGSAPELGAWNWDKAVYLSFSSPDFWSASIDILDTSNVEYKYAIKYEHGGIQYEWGDNRILDTGTVPFAEVSVRDSWRPANDTDSVLFSSMFTEALFKPDDNRHKNNKRVELPQGMVLRFQIRCPRIRPDQQVCLMGDIPELGSWDVNRALVLENPQHPIWQGEVEISHIVERGVNYKYGIRCARTGKVEEWETGSNRYLQMSYVPSKNGISGHKGHHHHDFSAAELRVVTDEHFRFSQPWRGAGVAIPVFALRSTQSFGCGEFSDLKLLVDWAKRVGLKVVQILPINDTVATHRWKDSYPYAAISVFALHPIYMNLRKLGKLGSDCTQSIIEEIGQRLNGLSEVDYEGVHKLKSRFFKLIFDEQKTQFLNDPEFLAFFAANKEWLVPYAVFSYLRDLYQTPNFNEWNVNGSFQCLRKPMNGGKRAPPTLAELEAIAAPNSPQYDDIAVHYFIQFHLHKQLLEASQYAKSNGIVLKGDIPIGIYRHSVDAWMYPNLFNMNMQAGAPPDGFAAGGQNWGFPTYNWEEMSNDGYGWWRWRLQKMSEYFSAFRIDHVLGFFRIWQIPTTQVQGIMGYFNPALPIHIEEMKQRGIFFDYDRFCKPFIREYMLHERFGDLTDCARERFLVDIGQGQYVLKPEVDNQQKVKTLLNVTEEMSVQEKTMNERLKAGLFSLIAEVLFFEVEGSWGHEFHPRHSMHFTRSYQALDDYTKAKLNDLYIDYFYKRQEGFWRAKAMDKLPAIKEATKMLICAEDLGMVPDCVAGVLDDLNMLRLAIQRMPADPKQEFWHPSDTPYLCVASPSCHDMSTIRGWWEEDRERSAKFYREILGHCNGDAPFFCEPSVVREVVVQHLYAPCMLSVFPIQDLVGMDAKLRRENPTAEQINNPANPEHYWRYRFHMNMEDLLNATEFNEQLADVIRQSGRN